MDLDQLIKQYQALVDDYSISPPKIFESWDELKAAGGKILQQPAVQQLFDHQLGKQEIILVNANHEMSTVWYRLLCLFLGVGLLIVGTALGLFGSATALVIGLLMTFGGSILVLPNAYRLWNHPTIRLVLTKNGPIFFQNGQKVEPDDQLVKALGLNADAVSNVVGLELVEFERRLSLQNAELDALRLLDEGYRQPDLYDQVRAIEDQVAEQDQPPEINPV